MLGLNPESICSLLTIFFLSYYTRGKMYFILTKFCNDYNFFNLFNIIMSSQVMMEQIITEQETIQENNACEKEEPKYEDKFLDDIRKMNKDFVFDEKEEELQRNKFDELFLLAQEEDNNKVSEEKMDETRLQIQEKAIKFVIDERLDKLKNSFIMEKTPLGNVLMLYNNKRGSFEYYSDNTIPYRYLEPVSRKYVKMFDCRPIYFDMEEELKNYERKLEEKEKEKTRILELAEEESKKSNSVLVLEPVKKNVFAKFKSYNKEAGTGHVNIAAPPKNSIPNNLMKNTESGNNNEKVLLKENANRYSYEGKLSNFNFLKKVDRKVVDKKYGMTFADFKRLQEEKKEKNKI